MSLLDYNQWAINGLYKQSYPLAVQIILLIISFYAGVFTLLNNFYVLRPKILNFSKKCKPLRQHKFANALYQTGLTLLLNLSTLSFAFCTGFLSSSANSLQVFAISDGIWMGMFCALIAYKQKDNKSQQIDRKLAIKNMIMLLLMYTVIVIHFELQLFFFHFPLVLFILYLLNQIMTQYFGKVYEALMFLLSDTAQEDDLKQIKKRKPVSQFPSIQTLSTQHAATQYEMNPLIEQFAERRSHIVLKSKAKVYQKLHDIYIRVHMAHNKFIESEIKRVIFYFGRLNGTIPLEKHQTNTFMQHPTITQSQVNLDSYNKISTLNEQQLNGIVQQQEIVQENPPDFLLYIFPIKMLEYSAPISVVFSLLLNLGLGFLLDFTLQVSVKIGLGTVFCCLLAFVVLPISVSTIKLVDYFNEMTSFSILRYGILGLFLFVSCFVSLKQGQLFYVTWIITPNLNWTLIAQTGFLIYTSLVILFLRWQQYRLLSLVFVMLLVAFGYLGYLDSLFIY